MAKLGETTTSTGGSDFGAGSADSSDGGFSIGGISGEILTKFLHVLEAALILLVAYFLTRWIKKKFESMEAAHEQQRTALNLLAKITSGFTIVIGLTLALKTVGLDVSLLVSVGLLGLSYGMKDVMKNYVAGILIFFKSPFKIGDIVKIKQFIGRVEKMDLQSTSIKTFDSRDITIYNSDIMIQSIANYSRYPMRRMEIVVQLGYGSDMNKALRVFHKVLANEPRILKSPKSSVIFKKFSETGVDILIRFWIQMPSNILAIKSALSMQIQQAFDDVFIFIPTSRAIEDDKNRYEMEPTKTKIKEFYELPLFADIKTPGQPGVIVPEMQVAPDVVDAETDEPDEF